MMTDGLAWEPRRGFTIPLGRQQEVGSPTRSLNDLMSAKLDPL